MYPDLSYFLHDLIGTEPDNFFSIFQTFGIFLVLAFLTSAYILKLEMKRKTRLGLLKPWKSTFIENEPPSVTQVGIQALIGFILGAKILFAITNWEYFKSSAADVLLSMEGSFIGGLIGAAILGFLKYRERASLQKKRQTKKKVKIQPADKIWDITVVAAISGIAGAKLFAIFESEETISLFLQDPLNTIFSGSGLAIYGGLIVAFIVVFFYVRNLGMKPIHIMDAAAPALIAGYGVGRMGCQFSGDGDWGIVNNAAQPDWWFLPDWVWSYDYPHNVINRGNPIEGCTFEHCRVLAEGVYPTPFYEIVMSGIIFIILWSLRKRINAVGFIFFLYVLLNGIERWTIEKIRINDKIDFLGMQLTQAEMISFALMIVGVVGMIYTWQRSKKQ